MFSELIRKKTIYISYSSGKSDDLKNSIKEKLRQDLEGSGFNIIDYQDLNKIGEKYNIQDLITYIGDGLYVITIIDSKYLSESIYTIGEICSIMHRGGVIDRVYPIYSDDSLVAYDLEIKNKDNLLSNAINEIKKNLPGKGITPARDVKRNVSEGCGDKVHDFLEVLDGNVNWAYKSGEYTKLVDELVKEARENTRIKPKLSQPCSLDYLEPKIDQGGTDYFQNSFAYTTANRNIFFKRAIEKKILITLDSNIRKNIIILEGKAGSGKTTITRKIIDNLLQKDNSRIYNEDGITQELIEGLKLLESNDKLNNIVIIDNIQLYSQEQLKELARMVMDENKFHLLVSMQNDISSEFKSIFDMYASTSHYKGVKLFDASEITEEDKSNLVDIYKEKHPYGENEALIKSLIVQEKAIAFISLIVFFDTNVKDGISVLLKELNTNVSNCQFSLIDILMSIYYFTLAGEKLWLDDIFSSGTALEESFQVLINKDLLTHDTYTFEAYSNFYSREIFQAIKEEYFDNSQKKVDNRISEVWISAFRDINTILKHRVRGDIQEDFKETFDYIFFDNFNSVLTKITAHDLFGIKNIILNSKVLDDPQRRDFFQGLVSKLDGLKIYSRKGFERYRHFYFDIENVLDNNKWDIDYKRLDLGLKKYYHYETIDNREKIINIDIAMQEYSTGNNVASYVLSEKLDTDDVGSLNNKTRDLIEKNVEAKYRDLNNLSSIDIKVFINLLSLLVVNSSLLAVRKYDSNRIFNFLFKKYKFDGFAFKTYTNALEKRGMLSPDLFPVEDILNRRLKGDFIILEFLIDKGFLKGDDISKVAEYFSRYYIGENPSLIYKLFSLYENNEEYFMPKMMNMLTWAINYAYRDAQQMSEESLLNIEPHTALGMALNPNYKEGILKFAAKHKNYNLIQKYINISIISDVARRKLECNKLNNEKYAEMINHAPKDLFKMLYTEHKTIAQRESFEEYKMYSHNQRLNNNIFLRPIEDKERYLKERKKAMLVFEVLAKYYLSHRDGIYINNFVANILRRVNYERYKEEIIKVYKVDIDAYIDDIDNNRIVFSKKKTFDPREKNIIDLANFYVYRLEEECKEAKVLLDFSMKYLKFYKNIKYANDILRDCQQIQQGNYRYIEHIEVPLDKVGMVLGKRHKTLNMLKERNNVGITGNYNKGQFKIMGTNRKEVFRAKESISRIIFEFRSKEIYKGIVKKTAYNGLLVRMPNGFDELLHISKIPQGRVDAYHVGDDISIAVLEHNENKIELVTKEYYCYKLNSPYRIGKAYRGKIKKIVDFGLFVEMPDGFDELLHISKVAEGRVDNLKERYHIGDDVSVVVLEKNDEKVELCTEEYYSFVVNEYNTQKNKTKTRYITRKSYQGTISSIVEFGIFVKMPDGFDALLHISKISQGRVDNLDERYHTGDNISVVVLEQNGKKVELCTEEYMYPPNNNANQNFLDIKEDSETKEDLKQDKKDAKRILIAKAMLLNNRIWSKVIERMGYEYDILHENEEISQKVATNNYDILFTDTVLLEGKTFLSKELLILTEDKYELDKLKERIINKRKNNL